MNKTIKIFSINLKSLFRIGIEPVLSLTCAYLISIFFIKALNTTNKNIDIINTIPIILIIACASTKLISFINKLPLLEQIRLNLIETKSKHAKKITVFSIIKSFSLKRFISLININNNIESLLKEKTEEIKETKNRLYKKEKELSEQSQILFKKENQLSIQKKEIREKEDEISKYINKVFEQQERTKIIKFIVDSIRESLDLNKVLEKTAAEIGRLINADRCLIGLYDKNNEKFNLLNEYKSESNLVSILDYQTETYLNKKQMKELTQRKRALIENDLNSLSFSSNLKPFLELYKIKSLIIVPLFHKNELLGIIMACQTKTKRNWEQNHIEVISDIGSQIGIAIKQAYLHKQLQEATNLKSQFLANMSHEFRTPLNAIIGFSDMILSGSYGNITTKQYEYINNISISGKHLLRLVNDILDLSKVESGNMNINKEHFDSKFIINETISLLSNLIESKNLQIKTNLDDAYLYTDIRIFRQIIFNLMSNAIKFTEEHGNVTINSNIIDGKDIMVEFIDTGIGIPENEKNKIFKQFTQLDSSYSRKQEGTGLGLALTKKLVELQDGKIGFESEENKGSRFWFKLSCIDTPIEEYSTKIKQL